MPICRRADRNCSYIIIPLIDRKPYLAEPPRPTPGRITQRIFSIAREKWRYARMLLFPQRSDAVARANAIRKNEQANLSAAERSHLATLVDILILRTHRILDSLNSLSYYYLTKGVFK